MQWVLWTGEGARLDGLPRAEATRWLLILWTTRGAER